MDDQVLVEHELHLIDGIELDATAFNADVLVQQRAVQALDNAVGLWAFDRGPLVLNTFQLEEPFIGG